MSSRKAESGKVAHSSADHVLELTSGEVEDSRSKILTTKIVVEEQGRAQGVYGEGALR